MTLARTGSQAARTVAVTGDPLPPTSPLPCCLAPKPLEGGKDRRTRVQGRGGRAAADGAHAGSSTGRLTAGRVGQLPDPRDT